MRADTFGLQQPWTDCGNHFLGNLILQRENVGQLAIMAIGPDMLAGGGVYELRCDAHAITALAHAPFEHITHAQFTTHLLYIDGRTFVGEARIARDHE